MNLKTNLDMITGVITYMGWYHTWSISMSVSVSVIDMDFDMGFLQVQDRVLVSVHIHVHVHLRILPHLSQGITVNVFFRNYQQIP
jgi:hypothetical protein